MKLNPETPAAATTSIEGSESDTLSRGGEAPASVIDTKPAASNRTTDQQRSARISHAKWQVLLLAALGLLLLFWHLGEKYLWQDEAQTAVLAERMLLYGRPIAYDGKNLITIDDFAAEDASDIDERASTPLMLSSTTSGAGI